ncbi:hypothetical protein AAMO2058_000768500 [Amorphochlora amoebiformis]
MGVRVVVLLLGALVVYGGPIERELEKSNSPQRIFDGSHVDYKIEVEMEAVEATDATHHGLTHQNGKQEEDLRQTIAQLETKLAKIQSLRRSVENHNSSISPPLTHSRFSHWSGRSENKKSHQQRSIHPKSVNKGGHHHGKNHHWNSRGEELELVSKRLEAAARGGSINDRDIAKEILDLRADVRMKFSE